MIHCIQIKNKSKKNKSASKKLASKSLAGHLLLIFNKQLQYRTFFILLFICLMVFKLNLKLLRQIQKYWGIMTCTMAKNIRY